MNGAMQKMYTSPNNLYVTGSPLLIAAGELLVDASTGSVAIRLGLRNIGDVPIRAVQVAITPLDSADRPLSAPIPYHYLDLDAPRDAVFGDDRLIPLPDYTTRAFVAAVTEVIFTDRTVWAAPGDVWSRLPQQKTLAETYGDAELEKQYRLRYGDDCVFTPDRLGDLWRCACGAINRGQEHACHRCGRQLELLLSASTNDLIAEKNARVRREQAEREAKEALEKASREAMAAAEKASREAKEAAARKRADTSANRTKKILMIAVPALLALVAALIVWKVVIPNNRYSKAVDLMNAGKYDEAITAFETMDGYRDSAEKIEEILQTEKRKAEQLEADGRLGEAAIAYYRLADRLPECRERSLALWEKIAPRPTIAAGDIHTVALRTDGTVVAVGNYHYGQCNVSDWTDIVAVAAGFSHTVGLRADGTVVAVGDNDNGKCDVSDWTDIVAVSASYSLTVGLRADGTVVVAGYYLVGEGNTFSDWTDIIAISDGSDHAVGLRADGTVVAIDYGFYNHDGRCDVSGWTDIVAVAAGYSHTVGLKADGTVVAVGDNDEGQCDVSDWTDIVAVSAGDGYTLGLRSDGTVVVAAKDEVGFWGQSDVSSWTDIVAVSAGDDHTLGLRADGTVVAVGAEGHGQCDVSDWTDIKLPPKRS